MSGAKLDIGVHFREGETELEEEGVVDEATNW